MSLGVTQVILILAIVLILFGAGKLPRVMGDLAKGVKNFKSGLKDDDDEPKIITAERDAASNPAPGEAKQPVTAAHTTPSAGPDVGSTATTGSVRRDETVG